MTAEELLRERRRAHRLARRVIRFLREQYEWDIRFKRLNDPKLLKRLGFKRPVVGVTVWDRYEILLDPSFEDFFAVLIHECLHAIYPVLEEDDVLGLERLIRRYLTPHYAREMLRAAVLRLR